MARKARIDFPGAWHHVMHRGARRAPVFRSDADFLRFFRVLDDSVRMFAIEVHAYALMPNHYHLLVRSQQGKLSRAMRHVNACYTQETNRQNRWDGPVFRGRFRSQLVCHEAHLSYLLAYIHLNPLRAGLVTRLTSDCWTSHLAYMGRERQPDWLSRDFFLDAFGGCKEVHDFVQNVHRGRIPWPEEMSRDTGFIPVAKGTVTRGVEGAARGISSSTASALKVVFEVTGARMTDLRKIEYGPRANPARRFAAYVLAERGGLTHRQTGEALGMSAQQVGNVLRRARMRDKDEQWAQWIEALNDRRRRCDE